MKDTIERRIIGEEMIEFFLEALVSCRCAFKIALWTDQRLCERLAVNRNGLKGIGYRSPVAYRFWLFLLVTVMTGQMSAQVNGDEDSGSAEWKMWSTAAMDIGFSKKAEMSLGYLRSYALDNQMQVEFNQASLSLSYDISKHLETKAGYIRTQSATSGKTTSRYFLRTMFKVNLNDKFKWTNGMQAEKHSVNERRFDYRLIFMTRIELRKRLEFLSLSPSVSYWVFYNIGGSAIQYYDTVGKPTIKVAPEGMHRARLWVNLNSKISDAVSVSLYYLRQFEFNLVGQETRINVTNPVTGKIARPYSNYNVAGVTLKLNLDL